MIEAYTAGFLDADGTVTLSKPKSGEDYLRYPKVEFYNCDVSILESLKNSWGGTIVKKPLKKSNHNDSYELRIVGNSAISLLSKILPYMLHEKKVYRAKLIVENYKNCTPRNGKYSDKQKKDKIELCNKVMQTTMRGNGG